MYEVIFSESETTLQFRIVYFMMTAFRRWISCDREYHIPCHLIRTMTHLSALKLPDIYSALCFYKAPLQRLKAHERLMYLCILPQSNINNGFYLPLRISTVWVAISQTYYVQITTMSMHSFYTILQLDGFKWYGTFSLWMWFCILFSIMSTSTSTVVHPNSFTAYIMN